MMTNIKLLFKSLCIFGMVVFCSAAASSRLKSSRWISSSIRMRRMTAATWVSRITSSCLR